MPTKEYHQTYKQAKETEAKEKHEKLWQKSQSGCTKEEFMTYSGYIEDEKNTWRPLFDLAIDKLCNDFDVPKQMMLPNSSTHKHAELRHVLAYVLVNKLHISNSAVSRFLGRNTSTIHTTRCKIAKSIEKNSFRFKKYKDFVNYDFKSELFKI